MALSDIIPTLLEMIGLSMAIIDMRLPKVMKRLENFIDTLGDELHAYAHKYHKEMWYQISFSLFVVFILVVGVGSLFGLTFPAFVWLLFIIIVGLGGSMIFVSLLGDFISLLNKFSVYDQATTTIGVFIAVIGLILNIVDMF